MKKKNCFKKKKNDFQSDFPSKIKICLQTIIDICQMKKKKKIQKNFTLNW